MSKRFVVGSVVLVLLIAVILISFSVNNPSTNVNNSLTNKSVSVINSLAGNQSTNGSQVNQASTSSSVQWASGVSDGMILHLDFENNWTGSGIVADTSGSGNNGDCGLLKPCPSQIPGIVGSYAAEFGGSLCSSQSKYIGINYSSSLDNLSNGAISVWENSYPSVDNRDRIMDASKVNTPGGSWDFGRNYVQNNEFMIYGLDRVEHTAISFPLVQDNVWTHYVVTWDGKTIKGYYNGNLTDVYPQDNFPNFTIEDYIAIGASKHNNQRYSSSVPGTGNCVTLYNCPDCLNSTGANDCSFCPVQPPVYYSPNDGWLSGALDDIRIYNRSLSSQDVWQLFSGSAPSNTCGNGIVESGEDCDDGNAMNGDGCSSQCQVEPGYSCPDQPSFCMANPVNFTVRATDYEDRPTNKNFAIFLGWDSVLSPNSVANSNFVAPSSGNYELWRSDNGGSWRIDTQTLGNGIRAPSGEDISLRVRLKNGTHYSSFSDTISLATIDIPTRLSVSTTNKSNATLLWYDNAGSNMSSSTTLNLSYGFRVWRSTDGVYFPLQATILPLQKQYFNSSGTIFATYTDYKNIQPNTTYYYRVTEYVESTGSDSWYSSTVSIAPGKVPDAPSFNSVLFSSYSSGVFTLKLNLVDNSNNDKGFIIQKSLDNSSWAYFCSITNAVGSTCTDSTLLPGLTYYYRAYAWNDVGNSSYTPVAVVTAPRAPPAGTNVFYASNESRGNNDGSSWSNSWNLAYMGWPFVGNGSTIYLDGGSSNITYSTSLQIGNSGNETNPIVIKTSNETGHNGRVIINNVVNFKTNNWITLDGSKNSSFIFNDLSKIKDNINIEITNKDNNCIVSGSAFGIKIKWLDLHNCGDNGDNAHAILFNGADFDKSEIAYNYIHDNVYFGGVFSINGPADRYGKMSIHHNIMIGAGEDMIDGGGGIDIYNNIIGVGGLARGGHPDAIQGCGGYFRYYNNIVYDFPESLMRCEFNVNHGQTNFTGWQIYNNLFYDTKSDMGNGIVISIFSNVPYTVIYLSNVLIANNVFYNISSQPITILTPNNALSGRVVFYSNFTIVNNIFHDVDIEARSIGGVGIGGDPTSTPYDNVIFDNNIVSGTGKHINFNGIDYQNASEMDANTAFKNNSAQTPSFIDLDNLNLRLSSTDTVGIDHGMNLSFFFNTDIRGVSRPQNGAWDIGAYEYVTGEPVCTAEIDTKKCTNQIGVCSGSIQTCSSAGGGTWLGCNATDFLNNNINYQQTETSCSDGKDNDCDGYPDLQDQNCLPATCGQCSVLGGNCTINTCHRIGNGRGECYYSGGTNCVSLSSVCSSINSCSDLNQYECKVGACGGTLDCRTEGSGCVKYDPSLLFYYSFESNFSSGFIEDVSGNGRNGDCDETKGQCPIVSTGSDKSVAVQFNGATGMSNSNYIAIDNATVLGDLTNLSQGTIYLWAYTNSTYADGLLMDTQSSYQPGSWYFGRTERSSNNRFGATLANGTSRRIISFPNIVANKWENYVVTWNGTNVSGYYNGVLVNTTSQADFPTFNIGKTVNNATTYIAIGADTFGYVRNSANGTYPYNGFFNGRMDEIRMYNRVLNASEILDLYLTTIGKFSVSLVSPQDGVLASSKNVNFTCSASYNTTITNITLYGNWSGVWKANGTISIGNQSGSSTFSRTLNDGSYRWNCLAVANTSEQVWAVSNYTLTVSSTATGFNPADLNGDRIVSSTESLNYTLYYKRQLAWPIPPSPIDAANWLFQRLLFKRNGGYTITGSGCPPGGPNTCWTAA